MSSVKVSVACVFVLVALSLLAAVPAQAVESEWLVEGKTLSESLSVSLVSKPVSLLVPPLGITIECKKAEGSGTIFKGGSEELKATLTLCTVVKLEACKVESLVLGIKTKMISAGNAYYDKAESSKEGTPLTKVVIKGAECPIAPKNKEASVTGAFATEITPKEEFEPPLKFSEKISAVVNSALKEEKGSELSLKYGSSTAYFSGEFVPPLNPQRRSQQAPFTRLCDIAMTVCGGIGTPYPANTVIEAVAETEVSFILGSVPIVIATCELSEFEVETLSAGGAPLTATVSVAPEGLIFRECFKSGGGECFVSAVGLPYELLFIGTGGATGYASLRNPVFEIECGAMKCIYGKVDIRFQIMGGAPLKYRVEPQVLQLETGSAEACVGTGRWEAAFPGGPVFYKAIFPPEPPEKAIFVTG
jgi:hypothetical protein